MPEDIRLSTTESVLGYSCNLNKAVSMIKAIKVSINFLINQPL